MGDVKVAMANLGFPIENIPRIQDPKMGGSILLDLGVYTLNFADIVFGGEKPESIHASGHLFGTGVDHTVSVTMLYSNKRTAQLLCTGGKVYIYRPQCINITINASLYMYHKCSI